MNRPELPRVLSILDGEDPDRVALVFDSPHSGKDYPADFRPALPMAELRRAEDMYIDELYAAAPQAGACLLAAHFPRIYLDANRPATDIDPELLAEPWPHDLAPSIKSRFGQGLIWRLSPEARPIYDRFLSVAECRARIDRCHVPYHAALHRILDQRHRRFGRVFHVNCHSMPATSGDTAPEGAGIARADVVLGDRDGTTAGADFVAAVEDFFTGEGLSVKRNDPYKGVELVRLHGDPEQNRHSLQIELNRRLYMDETGFEKTVGFAALKDVVDRLIATLADFARSRVQSVSSQQRVF